MVPQYPVQATTSDLDSLHRDIEDLIARTKNDFVQDISNAELQTRLKALVDLQAVLRLQQLVPEALQAVRNQVRDLQMSPRYQVQTPAPVSAQNPVQNAITSSMPGPPPSALSYSTPVQTHYAPPLPQAAHPQSMPEPQAAQPSSTTSLASLLASVQRNMQSQPTSQQQPFQSPQPLSSTPAIPSENPLLAQLRAAGMLSGNANGDINATHTPPVSSASGPPAKQQSVNLSDLLRQVATAPIKQGNPDRVELNSASLKM